MKLTNYKMLQLSLRNIVRSIKEQKLLQKELVKKKENIVKKEKNPE